MAPNGANTVPCDVSTMDMHECSIFGRLVRVLGSRSTARVGVFVEYAVDVLYFKDSSAGYPVSGPSDVNVLLYGDPGFAPAVTDLLRPWWRRIGT